MPPVKGTPLSEKSRQHLLDMIENNRGKHLSEEHKKKLSESHKGTHPWLGKHHTEETKQKIRAANKGQIPWLKGKKVTEETKLKISKAKIGKKHGPMSEETKNKLRESSSKYRHSEESKKKIGISNIGKHNLPKMSERMKEYHKTHPEIVEKLLLSRRHKPTKPEFILFNIIKSKYPDKEVKINHRVKIQNGFRFIDVAVPELMVGFEYDCPYWHKDKEKDLRRHIAIEAEGWKLTHYTNEREFEGEG